MTNAPGLTIHRWEGEGYQPLVYSHDWQVALLNWEPVFDAEKLGEIERHNQTDEVFVLVKGKAVLFTITGAGKMQIEAMAPNVIYNVASGAWHNLVATRDATWIIVENRGTHLGDTEFRQLTADELARVHASLPDWAERSKFTD